MLAIVWCDGDRPGKSVPWAREGTNAVFSMKDVRSGDDGEIGRSDGTSAASEVISEVSAASEHSAAVTIRRSGTVAESGCICRIGEVLCLFDNLRMMDSAQIRV